MQCLFSLETAMNGPRKALKSAKTYTQEEVKTQPPGECVQLLKPSIFATFRAFRGPPITHSGLE
jgi:hypothetical protein